MTIDITDIQPQQSGEWAIEEFTVTPNNMAAQFNTYAKSGRIVPPGTYRRLMRNGKCIMSNTPDEIEDFREFIQNATGSVLINGLGLGVVLIEILKKTNITDVTIIEISEDVINLVGPYFIDDHRVTIIHANALTWKRPKNKRYNAIWHDIWDTICLDNLAEMRTLHVKYARYCDWQGSWKYESLKRDQRREKERSRRLSTYKSKDYRLHRGAKNFRKFE